MMGRTFSLYLAGRFARAVLAAFAFVFALIYAVDLVEMLRRSGDAPKATAPLLALLSFLRTPTVAEQALPFAVLFGSMIAFLNLSRRLELVVARAAGVSVWQILAPPVLVIAMIGVISVAAYNPASAWMKQRSDEIENSVFGGRSNPWGDLWLRQKSVDGQAIIHAQGKQADGTRLQGVEVFNFDDHGNFIERVDAASGDLRNGYWELHDAKVVTPGFETVPVSTYLLATSLNRQDVAQAFAAPETVSFWRLPALADQTAKAGPRLHCLSFEISRASGASGFARGHGSRGRLLFIKILPNGWRGGHGFRWRRSRVHALCGDQSDQRSRRGRLHQRGRGGLVAGARWVFVWRIRVAAPRGWLMGSAVSSSV